jgi:hypothetical protein
LSDSSADDSNSVSPSNTFFLFFGKMALINFQALHWRVSFRDFRDDFDDFINPSDMLEFAGIVIQKIMGLTGDEIWG